MKSETFDHLLKLLVEVDRSRHIAAIKVAAQILDEEGAEKDGALEQLLAAFHRQAQARQFAESREEYSFTRAPDPSLPPGASYYPIGSLLTESPSPMTAYQVIDLVAPKYRYRYRLRRRVQNDLARFTAYFGGLVWLQIFGDREPVPTFERETVTSWLTAGGRAWIIAELERRAERRVISFRGRA